MLTYRQKKAILSELAAQALTTKKRLTIVVEFRTLTRRKENQQYNLASRLIKQLVVLIREISALEHTPALEEMVSDN